MSGRIGELIWNEPGLIISDIRAWILGIARMNFKWCTETLFGGSRFIFTHRNSFWWESLYFYTSWIIIHQDGFKYRVYRDKIVLVLLERRREHHS